MAASNIKLQEQKKEMLRSHKETEKKYEDDCKQSKQHMARIENELVESSKQLEHSETERSKLEVCLNYTCPARSFNAIYITFDTWIDVIGARKCIRIYFSMWNAKRYCYRSKN